MTTEQCSFCWDDIASTEEREKAKQEGVPEEELPGELCWWRSANSHEWTVSKYCYACVERVKNDSFNNYIDSVKTATCPKQLRKLIDDGPPIYVSDQRIFPVSPDDHVHEFRRIHPDSTEELISARLTGSVIGEEREQLWKELQAIAYEVGKKLIQKMSDPPRSTVVESDSVGTTGIPKETTGTPVEK